MSPRNKSSILSLPTSWSTKAMSDDFWPLPIAEIVMVGNNSKGRDTPQATTIPSRKMVGHLWENISDQRQIEVPLRRRRKVGFLGGTASTRLD